MMMCGNRSRNTDPSNQPYAIGVSCPSCSSSDCVRERRRNWHDSVFRLVGKFPWKCRRCLHRFYLTRRSLT